MSSVRYSVALISEVANQLRSHLLRHITQGRRQEDLCFALWRPSAGLTRKSALIREIITPRDSERELHGGVSFLPGYVQRVIAAALEHEAGIAFLHSHFTPGWQGMSAEDVAAERLLASRVFAATGLPLVGLTMGTDGALSARFWPRVGRGQFEREWYGTVRVVGDDYGVTFMERLAPRPTLKEALRRLAGAKATSAQCSSCCRSSRSPRR